MRLKMKVIFKEVNKKLSKIKDNLLMMSKMLMENTIIKKITNKNIKKPKWKEKLSMKNNKIHKSSFNLQPNRHNNNNNNNSNNKSIKKTINNNHL